MINDAIVACYNNILNSELIEATGCTEPIALALVGAVGKAALKEMPEKIELYCSSNMIKNCKSVTVPNSGGIKGMEAAVLLGIIGGDCHNMLQVLSHITDKHREQLKEELAKNYVEANLITNVPTLYILVKMIAKQHVVTVELKNKHTHISKVTKDDEVLFQQDDDVDLVVKHIDKSMLNLNDILDYGETADLTEVKEALQRQIDDNTAISQEGLTNNWGESVGKTIASTGNDVYTRAKAAAAAGSDARMNGCPMAVVINSGSGNQGMTVSLPIIEFAKEYNISQDKLYRALAIGNLIAIYQKSFIGALSAYCGAVSAAAAAGCAIAWLQGCSREVIFDTLTNDIGSIAGMVCDGAKSSCASKISLALEAAFMGLRMAKNKRVLRSGDGLIKENADATVEAIGTMAKEGMKSTDKTIVEIMLEK